jgi:hypothetical protein
MAKELGLHPASTSVLTAKIFLKDYREEGAICPCCDQYVRLYRRKITSAMAYGLILLPRRCIDNGGHWIHVENYLKSLSNIPASIRGDIAKLRHFGLIEAKQEDRDDGSSRNGFYRMTGRGMSFARGKLFAPESVFIYNNKVEGYSDKQISIHYALGNKFDYDELMYGEVA